jgi:hypothetical protein
MAHSAIIHTEIRTSLRVIVVSGSIFLGVPDFPLQETTFEIGRSPASSARVAIFHRSPANIATAQRWSIEIDGVTSNASATQERGNREK